MKDIVIPKGLGEGETFVHDGLTFTIKNGDLTVKDLDLGTYLYVTDADDAETGRKKAAKARYLISKHADDLGQFGPFHSVSEKVRLGSGADRDVIAHYLGQGPLFYIVPKTRTPKGKELGILMTHVFIAWWEGKLRPVGERPQPQALPKSPPLLGDPREIIQQAPVSPQLRSIEPSDDQMLAGEIDLNRLMKNPPEPEQILADETGELRMRYSMVAHLLDERLIDIYYYGGHQSAILKEIAPIWKRAERYGGFMRYHGEDGLHEASYFTLGQAMAIAVDRKKGHLQDEIIEAFNRHLRILSNYADEQLKHRATRAEIEAKMANPTTIVGQLTRMAEATEKVEQRLNAIESRATARPWWKPWG